MDETIFKGKISGKRGWGATGKWIVFDIYQKNGKVLTFPIFSRAKETMQIITPDILKRAGLHLTVGQISKITILLVL